MQEGRAHPPKRVNLRAMRKRKTTVGVRLRSPGTWVLYKNRRTRVAIIWGSSGLRALSLPSFSHHERLHLRYFNMSFAGAHDFVASNGTFNEAKTVRRMFTNRSRLMTVLNLLQINIHNNYGNRTTSDGVMTLMPNPSSRFTGRTEVIAKLKTHFFNTNGSARKRKFFLLYGMGGIGKTQICLKFVEELIDW